MDRRSDFLLMELLAFVEFKKKSGGGEIPGKLWNHPHGPALLSGPLALLAFS